MDRHTDVRLGRGENVIQNKIDGESNCVTDNVGDHVNILDVPDIDARVDRIDHTWQVGCHSNSQRDVRPPVPSL